MDNQKDKFIDMTSCFNDPQTLLATALENNNLAQFQAALNQNASASRVDTSKGISVFERACKKPGCAKFIQLCIENGCDVNKSFGKYYPINLAAASQDPDNIRILSKYRANVNAKFESATPIKQIISALTEENIDKIFECIKILVENGADVNIPDHANITPILLLADDYCDIDGVEEIIKYLFENSEVDLDGPGNEEIREILHENFPNLQLPTAEVKRDINLQYLKELLRGKRENKFISNLDNFMNKNNNNKKALCDYNDDETILQIAVIQNLPQSVRKIIQCGAPDILNACTRQTVYSPIAISCQYGYYEILEILLNENDIEFQHREPLLNILIKRMQNNNHDCDYTKCFRILLNKVDINEVDLHQKSSALHCAVRYKNDMAVRLLLNKRAYIGSKNAYNELPITDIKPKLMEEHLNSCITTNDRRPGDENFEIIFDYSSLVPPSLRSNLNSGSKFDDEMVPIEYMTKQPELRKFISHPLISSFLWLKWHRLSTVFYLNFAFFSVFCLAMITYLVVCYGREESSQLAPCLYAISVLGLCYLIVRESLQLIMSPITYMKYWDNYIEVGLIGITIVILFIPVENKEYRKVLAAVAILLFATEFSLLVGSLPFMSISTHMVMLKSVSITFMRSFLLYSIIIVSFALCFYTLLGDSKPIHNGAVDNGTKTDDPKTGQDKNDDDDGEFNKFTHPGLSIVKTLVMFTGEFEAADLKFGENTTAYIIFVLFVFFISIVLLNLLNGLAVSDTQAIKAEAELTGLIYRAQLLARYERMTNIHNNRAHSLFSKVQSYIVASCSNCILNLFQSYLPYHLIIIRPNQNRQIYIQEPPNHLCKVSSNKENIETNPMTVKNSTYYGATAQTEIIPLPGNIFSCTCVCQRMCSQLDAKIVKNAQNVIEARKEENLQQSLEDKIENLEKLIHELLAQTAQRQGINVK